jgi:predicted heme/steroid binding protein
MSDSEKQITEEELRKCDGQEGRPAWVAYRGQVYDVSASQRWRGGMHMKRHQVGNDLTSEFAAAPHDESVLQRMPVVGRLVAAAFLTLHLVTGIESLVDAAYYALLGGTVVAPFTMLTGAVSWWFNYGHKLKSPFQGKAGLSMALAAAAVATVVLWALNRDALLEREAVGWVYFVLVIVMSVLVLSLGKLGGALVFPPRKKPGQKR